MGSNPTESWPWNLVGYLRRCKHHIKTKKKPARGLVIPYALCRYSYKISTKLGLSFPGNIRKGIRDWIKEQSNGKIQAKKSAKISKMKIKPRTIIISSSCS